MVARIYLAGPITGLDHAGAVGWRERVRAMLGPEIRCYSPMRSKLHLAGAGPLTAMGHAESVLSSPRGIMTRDHWDCAQADLIFVNLLGAERVSIGTVMEIAFAHAYRKPVVAAMEKDNTHEHAMLCEAIGFRCATLEEAADVARAILLPDCLPAEKSRVRVVAGAG